MKTQIKNSMVTSNYLQYGSNYINAIALYLDMFHIIPNMLDIHSIDAEKACKEFIEMNENKILDIITKEQYSKNKHGEFEETYLILENEILVLLCYNYAEIYFQEKHITEAKQLAINLSKYKERKRRKPLEINLIVQGPRGLELQEMEVKRTKLDIDLFYNNDFKEVDQIIRTRLKKQNDKGIILLHGLPGTGKTSYLRHLIGKINKKVMFFSPNIASGMTDPGFMNLLINNPNSVVIIEDADNIIMDRGYHANSSVSNLLNISDGLLSDFLNIQLICTFNSPLTMIDKALMRKGRLIAKYEFGKLSIEKSKRLSHHLGNEIEIAEPMTLAELANHFEPILEENVRSVIGFRRTEEILN
jgi:SpoVK/Ycf46/Vps4 family AAA+-type ATPase